MRPSERSTPTMVSQEVGAYKGSRGASTRRGMTGRSLLDSGSGGVRLSRLESQVSPLYLFVAKRGSSPGLPSGESRKRAVLDTGEHT